MYKHHFVKVCFLFLSQIIISCGEEQQLIISDIADKVILEQNLAASYCFDNNVIYAGDVSNGLVNRSFDKGISWEKVYRFKKGKGAVRCIFVSHKGTIFASRDRSGELIRSEDNGSTFKTCLYLSDKNASTVWHITENKKGWLYTGEYSNLAWEEACAYIYRSKDDGKNWSIVYNNPHRSRHIHFVAVDPFTEYIYAATGDGSDRAYFIRSTDDGNSWVTLGHDSLNSEIDWQFTSIVFTPNYRILGEDDPKQSDIVRTADDLHFEKVFVPTDIERYNFWAWGRIDSRSNILFGSWTQHIPAKQKKGRGVIYLSEDEGRSWTRIVDFGIQTKKHGGTHFASNVFAEDWILCHNSGPEKSFKLRIK